MWVSLQFVRSQAAFHGDRLRRTAYPRWFFPRRRRNAFRDDQYDVLPILGGPFQDDVGIFSVGTMKVSSVLQFIVYFYISLVLYSISQFYLSLWGLSHCSFHIPKGDRQVQKYMICVRCSSLYPKETTHDAISPCYTLEIALLDSWRVCRAKSRMEGTEFTCFTITKVQTFARSLGGVSTGFELK